MEQVTDMKISSQNISLEIPIIDSHVHYWETSVIPLSWLTSEPNKFDANDFKEQTKDYDIEGIVLVEPCSDSSRFNNYSIKINIILQYICDYCD